MAIIPVGKVEYLVFSGGGGKGIVHIGGARAVESLLKVDNLWRARSMKGFAGASAGALIAMMLAMGYSSREARSKIRKYFGGVLVEFTELDPDSFPPLKKVRHMVPLMVADAILKVSLGAYGERETDREEALKQLMRARKIMDYTYQQWGNETEDLRQLEREVLAKIHKNLFLRDSFANDPLLDDLLEDWDWAQDNKTFVRLLSNVSNSTGASLGGLAANISIEELANAIYMAILKNLQGTQLQVLIRSRDDFDRYVYNFLFGKGLIPGFCLREAVRRIAAESPAAKSLGALGVEGMTFRQLDEIITKQRGSRMDLVVSGTNLTTQTVHYFSRWHTPSFRVIDAVAISMTYPFLFKPVMVRFSKEGHPLHGNWVDGGMLNNLPIHAFDRGPDRVLNHHVVAFRIKEEHPGMPAMTIQARALSNFRSIFDTLLAQGSEGQIRTEVERLQTIVLGAPGLSTLDLIPDWRVTDQLIDKAERATRDYFSPTKTCYPVVTSWAGKDPDPPLDGKVFEALARNQMRGAYAHVSARPLHVQPYRNRSKDTTGVESIEIDIVAGDGKGFTLYEAKASSTARISPQQSNGIKLLYRFGGYLASSLDTETDPDEVTHFQTHASVAPQAVRVLRPGNLCREFDEAKRVGGKASALKPQPAAERGKGYPIL